MQRMLKNITRELSGHPFGWAVFFASSVVIFLLLVMIPVWSTPGHDFLFQLELLGVSGVALVAVLSLGNGLLLALQMIIKRKVKKARSLKKQAVEVTTLTGIIVSSLSATLACAACYSALLAAVGVGATAFIVEYQVLIAVMALAITGFAIRASARRLDNACRVCKIG